MRQKREREMSHPIVSAMLSVYTLKLDGNTFSCEILTMHEKQNSLADRWRHAVGRDAKIRPHLQSVHLRDIEDWSVNGGHCDRWSAD